MMAERNISVVKNFSDLAPAEEFVLSSFSFIQKKKFQGDGDSIEAMLDEDVIFVDPHYKNGDPIRSKNKVIMALIEEFKSVKDINFEITDVGIVRGHEGLPNRQKIAVFTNTTTTLSFSDGDRTGTIGQAFLFEVKDENRQLSLTNIKAYPQYPPPDEG